MKIVCKFDIDRLTAKNDANIEGPFFNLDENDYYITIDNNDHKLIKFMQYDYEEVGGNVYLQQKDFTRVFYGYNNSFLYHFYSDISKYFYTEKEYRMLKLKKLNGKQ